MRKFNMNPLWLAALLPAILIGGCRTFVGPSETEAELASTPQRRLPVDLEMTGKAVILSRSGVSTTGTTAVVGSVGVSPIAANANTGFGPVLNSSNTDSTPTQ